MKMKLEGKTSPYLLNLSEHYLGKKQYLQKMKRKDREIGKRSFKQTESFTLNDSSKYKIDSCCR